MADMPDEYLIEVLPVVKKIAAASGAENWNLLQNNGRLAHQEVDHVSTSSDDYMHQASCEERRGVKGRLVPGRDE